jgi:peptidoglycan hydrolase-like protein with peptidoglycan-binding domain
MFRVLASAALVIWAASAGLADTALLIANERYTNLSTARGAGAILGVERELAAAGFRTDLASDSSAAAMRAALASLSERIRAGRDERVILVFAGYAVHGPQGAWLMGTDTRSADLATLDATGVRLDTILAIAGELQGGALVAIADLGFPTRPGAGLTAGLPAVLTVPQGVTVARGPVPQLAAFLRDAARPGTNLSRAAQSHRNLRLDGFVPPYLTFLPAPAQASRPTQPSVDADQRAWSEAQETNTLAAYRTYLDEFPNGRFAAQARAAVARLDNSPEQIESRLNLSRDERRAIQRHLALLGFDPRGVDGIFGAGTRGAIGSWQAREGFVRTTFLDRDQIHRLAQQAARRAAELEAEARARQAEQERQDRAYWRDSGAGRDEAGLRAYLDRFPDGIFSGIARERIEAIEAERRAQAQARDRAAWDAAVAQDSVQAYRQYLAEFPRGAFVQQATVRIEELSRPPRPDADLEAARAQEAALQLPRITRVLIEQRLAFLGFDPGMIDGEFDRDARRAIRQYQRANGLPATGYLTQQAVARLLAGGLLRLLE